MNEPLIKEVGEEELKFLAEKKSEYTRQGMSDKDAHELAMEDWKKLEANKNPEIDEAAWDQITKNIGLFDFLDDQIRRALGKYKSAWEKANPEQTMDFKLHLKTHGGVGTAGNKRLISGVSLILEKAQNGSWTVWREKKIEFTHIREMREGHKWKLALYEAMLHDLIAFGISYLVELDNIKNNANTSR